MFFLFDFIYTLVTPSSKSCIDTKQKIKQISQEEAHDSISNVLEVFFFLKMFQELFGLENHGRMKNVSA